MSNSSNPTAVAHITQLDLDSFPSQAISRALLEVTQDGRGLPIEIPLLIAKGKKHGRVCGITAALHGNEVNGIPVIHQLMEKLNLAKLRGTIIGVAPVNVPSYLRHRRRFTDHVDLNHIMPGTADGNVSDVYAYRVFHRLVRHFDYLIDLHTASFGRINTLYVRADMDDPDTAKMARLQHPRIILHNPPSDRTLRGAAMELGIPAITVEIGDPHVFQPRHIRASLRGVRRVLAEFGFTKKRPNVVDPVPVLCQRSYWLYTDHGGLLEIYAELGEIVEQGHLLARVKNIFGDVVAEYLAPERGILIGKSTNPVGQTGARILHLGIMA
jgi:predicted deacylase